MSSDLLIEIGTEELPTQAVQTLSAAFANNMLDLLAKNQIAHQDHFVFATPRRIALYIKQVAEQTPAQSLEHRGPPLSAAYKTDGTPTPAAAGFAQRFNVKVETLERVSTDKGEYLIYKQSLAPIATSSLLLNFIETALNTLPIKKPMSWGSNTFKFVRPVHWALVLFGTQILAGELFGQTIGRTTKGHRFLNNTSIDIDTPEHYAKKLYEQGFVVAQFDTRKNLIKEKMNALADKHALSVVLDEALLNEVTCLVEWPVALLGTFDERFLKLPPEVISCTLKLHQKTFVLENKQQQLQPYFITIANIDSKDPKQVISGNEKVVRARLTDAEFFFNQDKKVTLEQRLDGLAQVIFQQNLGSLLDKSKRISDIAKSIAPSLHLDENLMAHAGMLCKADLISAMVGEFPELQGIMGAYYAQHENQDSLVVSAIKEHYLPQGAADQIPQTLSGAALSIADKLDTVCGIFALGKKPSGDKDPFALKRAMIGVLRIIIDKNLYLDLKALLSFSLAQQPATHDSVSVLSELLAFSWDRLEALLRDQQYPVELLNCVTAIKCSAPYDMYLRIQALHTFRKQPEAESLAGAHKRANNLLSKQDRAQIPALNENKLLTPHEKQLAHMIKTQHTSVSNTCEKHDYSAALLSLAQLKPALDDFFDNVMVMDEDRSLRENRLALLVELDKLFLHVADFSYLQ